MFTRKIIITILLTILAAPIYPTFFGCGGGMTPDEQLSFNISDDGDFDKDGVLNKDDPDDDNDGILDVDDAFPFDSAENGDLDGDGIGNSVDEDADGDGVAKADDCNDLNAGINPTEIDTPDDSALDANCDGMDGTIDGTMWVSDTEGNDTNVGTITEPVKTISKAIDLASVKAEGLRDIYVVAGTYPEDVLVVNGVNLYGGYSTLVDGKRTRDLTQFKATIPGKDSDKKINLPGFGMAIDYTLAIDNSASTIIDGLIIIGDPIATGVFSFNSNSTIKNCDVSETVPTVTRDKVFTIIAASYSTTYVEHTFNVLNNKINLKGNFTQATDESDFGIIALPDKNSEAMINVNVMGNEINTIGTAETLATVYVMDNDNDPNDAKESDTKGGARLVAKNNKININGNYKAVSAITGGMYIDGSLLSADYVFIESADISNNIINVSGAEATFSICVGAARSTSVITNNVISAKGIWGTAAITNFMAPTNIYYNTASLDAGQTIGIYSLSNPKDLPSYQDKKIQNVENNIFYLDSTLPGCMNIGVIESTTSVDATLEMLASPEEMKNNDIYITDANLPMPICAVNLMYHDSQFASDVNIASINDMNNKVGLAANDPTDFANNIAVNPLFIDMANGDFQLKDSSTLIDAGLDFEDGWLDILGVARPVGDGVDIGAYEK